MMTGQSMHSCLRREVPLTTRHTAKRSGDSCGESQRLSFGGRALQRPKRNTRSTWVSAWTSEQLVESAKILPKPRRRTAKVG